MRNSVIKPKSLQAILAEDESLTKKISYDELQSEEKGKGMDCHVEDAYKAYCEFCKKEVECLTGYYKKNERGRNEKKLWCLHRGKKCNFFGQNEKAYPVWG